MSSNMRTVSIICCVALLALNAASLFAVANQLHLYFSGASLAVTLALLVVILVNPGKAPEPEQPNAEAAKPIPIPAAQQPGRSRNRQLSRHTPGAGPVG